MPEGARPVPGGLAHWLFTRPIHSPYALAYSLAFFTGLIYGPAVGCRPMSMALITSPASPSYSLFGIIIATVATP